MYTLAEVRIAILIASCFSIILGTVLGWQARWWHIKYKVRKARDANRTPYQVGVPLDRIRHTGLQCGVPGCTIRKRHSHTEALIRKMKGQ